MTIPNYDQEIEKRYHPENFDELLEPVVKMPRLIKTKTWQGYDVKEIKKFLGASKYRELMNWFAGKTGGITEDGRYCIYDYDFKKGCEAIGLMIGKI